MEICIKASWKLKYSLFCLRSHRSRGGGIIYFVIIGGLYIIMCDNLLVTLLLSCSQLQVEQKLWWPTNRDTESEQMGYRYLYSERERERGVKTLEIMLVNKSINGGRDRADEIICTYICARVNTHGEREPTTDLYAWNNCPCSTARSGLLFSDRITTVLNILP